MSMILLAILVIGLGAAIAAGFKYKVWSIYEIELPRVPQIILNPSSPNKDPMEQTLTPMQVKIHGVLTEWLGRRCTLNAQIPPDVGCAEAVSFLLDKLGINDGLQGIAGTGALLAWVESHPTVFEEIEEPEESALLISATGTGNGTVEGHTGLFGGFGVQYPKDWGIVSNNGQLGVLGEQWSWETSPNSWTQWYTQVGGIRPRMFRVLG